MSKVATLSTETLAELALVLIHQAMDYPDQLSRNEYEAACVALNIDTMSDADCQSYGVKYGEFSYPHYAGEYVAIMRLAYKRMKFLEKEAANAAKAPTSYTAPRQEGQLWEPCEHCGTEPVYMPLNLCDRCWPNS